MATRSYTFKGVQFQVRTFPVNEDTIHDQRVYSIPGTGVGFRIYEGGDEAPLHPQSDAVGKAFEVVREMLAAGT